MTERFDTVEISSYVDGELSLEETLRVERLITENRYARDCVLKMLAARSLHKASLAEVEAELPPQEFYRMTYQDGHGFNSRFGILKRLAAVLVISLSLIGGYWAGEMNTSKESVQNGMRMATLVPQVGEEYRHVIDFTLEHSETGSSGNWQGGIDRSVVVTPVQTYRGKDKRFYRLYRLEITEGSITTSLLCLAYRTGRQQWRNQAMIYEEGSVPI